MEGVARTVPKFRSSKAPSQGYSQLIEQWKYLSTSATIGDDSSLKFRTLEGDDREKVFSLRSSAAVKFPQKIMGKSPAPLPEMQRSSPAGGQEQKKEKTVKFVASVRQKFTGQWKYPEEFFEDADEPEQMETDYNERGNEDDEFYLKDELELEDSDEQFAEIEKEKNRDQKLMDGDYALYADVDDFIFGDREMVAKLKPFMDKVDRQVRMYADQIHEVDSSGDETDYDDVENYADLEKAGEQKILDGDDDNGNNPSTANVGGDHKMSIDKKCGHHLDHRNRKSGRRSGPNLFFDVKPPKKDDECEDEEILKMRLSRLPRRLGLNNMKVDDLVAKVKQLRAEQKAYLEERERKIFDKANNRKKTYYKSLKLED